jgi:hypothetical protein
MAVASRFEDEAPGWLGEQNGNPGGEIRRLRRASGSVHGRLGMK